MLRRYLIVNGITTALAYGAFYALVPSGAGMAAQFSESIRNASMQSPMLAPLVHRVITVTGRW